MWETWTIFYNGKDQLRYVQEKTKKLAGACAQPNKTDAQDETNKTEVLKQAEVTEIKESITDVAENLAGSQDNINPNNIIMNRVESNNSLFINKDNVGQVSDKNATKPFIHIYTAQNAETQETVPRLNQLNDMRITNPIRIINVRNKKQKVIRFTIEPTCCDSLISCIPCCK